MNYINPSAWTFYEEIIYSFHICRSWRFRIQGNFTSACSRKVYFSWKTFDEPKLSQPRAVNILHTSTKTIPYRNSSYFASSWISEITIFFRFQQAVKAYGVPQEEIFQTADLFERRNIVQVTLCLYALGRIVSKRRIITLQWSNLTIKHSLVKDNLFL